MLFAYSHAHYHKREGNEQKKEKRRKTKTYFLLPLSYSYYITQSKYNSCSRGTLSFFFLQLLLLLFSKYVCINIYN